MEKATLPIETAQEPAEEAHQPMLQSENTMSASPSSSQPKKRGRNITFADVPQSAEVTSSQCNSSYNDVLSQPGPGLSQRQRLLWLQKRRKPGLWVQCDKCDKWRYLPHVIDSHELPDKWYCSDGVSTEGTASSCSAPEEQIRVRDEEHMIHSEYSAGSVVWARLGDWPWWPAMVDDCPDTEQFFWLDGYSDIPTYYNVTFFDASEVTRAWITPKNLKLFSANKNVLKHVLKIKKYKKRLEAAFKQANDADSLPLVERLAKYSFVARYNGPVLSPKKISKLELKKFQNKLKRQLDIDFSEDSDSDSTEDLSVAEKPSVQRRREMRNNNIILVGTPKKQKRSSNKQHVESEDTVFKMPNSTSAQVGSPVQDTMAIDNDSSRTYVPESEKADASPTETEFQVRIATPSSDDFEF